MHYSAYIAVSSFYWFLWAINQEIQGKSIGEYLYILEFLYICKKIIDVLVGLATVFEEETAKLLAKMKEKKL